MRSARTIFWDDDMPWHPLNALEDLLGDIQPIVLTSVTVRLS